MRHVGTLALLASSAAAAGGAAWFARGRLSHVRTGTCANPAVHPGSATEAARIRAVAERFRRLWPEVSGDGEMPKAALEMALSQAFLESGVAEAAGGGWWKDKTADGGGNMVGSGNLGARQCGANDEGGDYYTCVEYGDSRPNADGTQTYFPAKFRYYKAGTVGGKQRDAGDAAAYEFLRDITHQWPALAELKSGDVLAYAMRQGPKYRSGDPPNQKVFGREYKGGNGYYGGFGATMQERVGGYARAMASHLPAIAAALGHDRVYACVAPEVAAGGPVHAAVSGQLEGVCRALHSVGALPRARAIPGSNGAAVVWYVQQAQVVSGAASEDTMKTQEIVAILNSGAPLPVPPTVEGVVSPTVAAIAAFASGAIVGSSTVLVAQKLDSRRKDATTILPEPPPPIAPPPAHQPRTYTIKAGDSPFKVAVAYNASSRAGWWHELTKSNPQKETRGVPMGWKQLLPGEVIIIPNEWPNAAPSVEGVGTTALIAVAAATTAAVVGAEVEHLLKKKEKAKEQAAEQKRPQADTRKGATAHKPPVITLHKDPAPTREAVTLPALDEDRGSLAALHPLISLPSAPAVAPSPVTLQRPQAAPVALPALDQDRGSVAAIQSNKLTRDDMKQMFPAYTDAQIDEALKQMQPDGALTFEPATKEEAARRTFHGLTDDMRADLARLARVEARDADSQDDREHLTTIANDLSGEEHVTKESAAASDAYMTAQHPVEGVGKTVAIAAGAIAATGVVAAGALYEREHRLSGEKAARLRGILKKHGWSVEPMGPVPPGYVSPMDLLPNPTFAKAIREYRESLSSLDKLTPSGDPAIVLDWLLEHGTKQLAYEGNDVKVEGVGTAVAVTAGGLLAGGALAALLSKVTGGESQPAPAPAPVAAPALAPAPPKAPPAKPKGALSSATGKIAPHERPASDPKADLRMAEDELAAMYTRMAPSEEIAAKQAEIEAIKARGVSGVEGFSPVGRTVVAFSSGALTGAAGATIVAELLKGRYDTNATAPTKIQGGLGAKEKPDDVDKAMATGSDVADAASGLLQVFSAGKHMVDRFGTKEDPKCRATVKAYVDNHPVLSQVLRLTQAGRDVRSLASSLSGASLGAADIESFKERYVAEIIRRRASLGHALDDCAVTPEEDRAVLMSLGARKSDLDVFAESLSHWAPDKVLPAAANAFKTAAPAAAAMYRGGAGGGAMADLSSLLPQQTEHVHRQATPPPPEPVVVEKGVSTGLAAVIAAGAAAAAAIVVAVVKK